MDNDKNISKKAVGKRFRRFRETIGKAQHQMASELGISQSTIANIERGKAFPNISYLQHFISNYNLNINWLLSEEGEIRYCHGELVKDKYLELMALMNIPVIEQVILAKLIELKALLKDEIKAFKEEKKKELEDSVNQRAQ